MRANSRVAGGGQDLAAQPDQGKGVVERLGERDGAEVRGHGGGEGGGPAHHGAAETLADQDERAADVFHLDDRLDVPARELGPLVEPASSRIGGGVVGVVQDQRHAAEVNDGGRGVRVRSRR
ncbi:hypothetical protein PV735_36260 [Streptomyces turgidiscabies]|uniref:hypothetical protein n=1 Tax=Streptomyces turgidiscabies TaxID=85558 RepID=UPI0018F8B2E7|nr:hypothetical protein [Streptomyces turgidiscabies]MDX3498102.1 hypothetical protein [Streptomyces turgidiscabies]